MAEGEHTIISKIPRERLNQIAARKLSALGIPLRLAADRETLEGDLAFAARVSNPVSGAPLTRARFVVSGHDHLRFLDPPLAALGPVLFYDAERTGALEARVGELLTRRAAVLHDLAARLRALRMEAVLEPERLLVRTVVKSAAHAFELLAGPEGVRVSRVAPVGGKPFEVSPRFPALTLEHHATLADLELFLDARVGEMRAPPPAVQAGSTAAGQPRPRASARLEVAPPPRNAVTLEGLERAFGTGCAVAPNAPLEIFQDLQCDGTRYRFVATREAGTTFKGRLIGPKGDVWADRFDLHRFPGVASLVASALGAPVEVATASPAAPTPPAAGAGAAKEAAPGHPIPEYMMPRAGEVWVMNVVVEQAGDEVRYVGTDIDGHPYGAARVLKRAEFEAVFSRERNGWRLLVIVDGVQEGSVFYRQLDPQRQPTGAPRRMPASVLVANFVPEAAAY